MEISPQHYLESLRAAAASGDFATAGNAAHLYVGALEATLPRLPPAQAAAVFRDACATLEWSRRCLCAARARLADELRRAQSASAYRGTPKGAVHTWKMVG